MNSILIAARRARARAADRVLRKAESDYDQAMKTFGVDSAEAKVAWHHWHALRHQARG